MRDKSGAHYLVGQGLHNLRANRMMTVASIGVLCACMLITGAATLLTVNVNSFVNYLGGQNEVVIFLQDGLEQTAIDDMQRQLDGHDNVASATFVSKEEALQEEMEYMGEYADLLASYSGDENPLPASFRVSVDDLARMDETVAYMESLEGIDYVKNTTELVSALLTLKRTVSIVGGTVVLALAAVSLVVVANTIRLTVFARRKEINIMKFVGATNGFIRLPFLVEGVAIGLISAVVAFVLVSAGYYGIVANFSADGAFIQNAASALLPYSKVALPLGGAFLLSGVLVGGGGSAFSISKHLHV